MSFVLQPPSHGHDLMKVNCLLYWYHIFELTYHPKIIFHLSSMYALFRLSTIMSLKTSERHTPAHRIDPKAFYFPVECTE